ncbi:RidA family protein [Undibacterium sp. CY18W]|uniref:RidA family protein n=1 Tax=Undibacterium hunanense TaxID=2762292 RepID=A0ABR6ZTM6_9BURK|nr:RidA family protein [Undibacterium hunanense]MBC3919203.1 RidA family protein [Undibacterium hunanense]
MTTIAQKLQQLGHILPPVKAPAANYVSYTVQNNVLIIAGQIGRPGAAKAGVVGAGLSPEIAKQEAEIAALGVLAVIDAVTGGDISRIAQVQRLGVFIAATPDFDGHSAIANGASDLIVATLGERGHHARTAIGVASLPTGAAVEVDAIVQLNPA